MDIKFTKHAEEKLSRLRNVGVTKKKVIETVKTPQQVLPSFAGRWIAQAPVRKGLVLRVVYKEENQAIVVITMYPGRERRYAP